MSRSFISIALIASASFSLAAPALASEEAAPPPSYSTSWQTDYATLRSIMFPHEIEGCKVMIQSRRGDDGSFIEKEGPDCDCNLVIDGMEDTFTAPPEPYTADKQFAICQAPGIDGNTRRLEIMRESLKEIRDFSDMGQVEGF